MKIFSPILKGTTTVSQGTTNLSGSFTGSLFGTAATASYADNFTVGGTLTAQTINVQIITSSIEFNTGSTRNGALSTNTHQFTGSVSVSGSVGIGTNAPSQLLEVVGGEIKAGRVDSSNEGGQVSFGRATDNNTAWYIDAYGNVASPQLRFVDVTGAAVRMVLTGSNVGIGLTGPRSILEVQKTSGNTSLGVASGFNLLLSQGGAINEYSQIGLGYTNANSPGVIGFLTTDAAAYTSGALIFATRNATTDTVPSERMRIAANGDITITSALKSPFYNITQDGGFRGGLYAYKAISGGGTDYGTTIFAEGGTGNGNIYFCSGGSATIRMTISTTGNIGAPSGTNIYNASDIRLKQNVSPTTYGLNTISLLNPVKFNWVNGFEPSEDGKDMLGFVAQEVQTVIPEAVESFGGNSITVGDTVIENPLRVNEKFIIPVLVKAIQELKSENDTLKEILQRNNIQ
jgi:hypothetical protein